MGVKTSEYGKYLPVEWQKEFPDILRVGIRDEFRACKVMKTRCIVVVDEGDGGKPVTETWEIKNLSISKN